MISTRREFLGNVGRGMLVAGVGAGLARELGLAATLLDEEPGELTFGDLEPLVALMQGTAPAELLPILVGKLEAGVSLRTLVAAGALANARTCGGEDYTGYHAFMALLPSYEMSRETEGREAALPVLKVLHRNTQRIGELGGRGDEKLRAVEAAQRVDAGALRRAMLERDFGAADRAFLLVATESGTQAAYDALQREMIQDDVDVHRIVLAWRAWDMRRLTGEEHASTLLRQSVHFCVDTEEDRVSRGRPVPELRALLPQLMEEHAAAGEPRAEADDDWVWQTALAIFGASRADAARIAAQALAEGYRPEALGEALSIASNRLLLSDPGRSDDAPGKPRGSVHGATVGVHASDSANAWRNVARVASERNRVASLIVGAYHTAGQSQWVRDEPIPYGEKARELAELDRAALLAAVDARVRERDQLGATAATEQYRVRGHDPEPLFELLRGHGTSQDGALHAEKYYRTVREEFAATRPAFRWNHLLGLARVTASEYGFPASGYAQARELLKV